MAFAAAGSADQNPSIARADIAPAQTGTVIVTVLEKESRQAIPDARVMIGMIGDVVATTGSDGRVRFENVRPGSYWVFVDSPTHVSSLQAGRPMMVGRILPPPDLPSEKWAARNPSHPGTRPLTVRPGRHDAVEFILPRGAVIAGQVLTLAETPVQNAPVDVLERKQ